MDIKYKSETRSIRHKDQLNTAIRGPWKRNKIKQPITTEKEDEKGTHKHQISLGGERWGNRELVISQRKNIEKIYTEK